MNNIIKGMVYAAGGAAVGFVTGLLIAPKSGKETRQEMEDQVDHLKKQIKKYTGSTNKELREKIEDLQKSLS